MRKIFSTLSVAVILFALSAACQQPKDKTEQTESTQEVDSMSTESIASASYTCSMHPEVVSDKPGKCPKCNMDLVVKKSSDMDGMHSDTTNLIH